MQEKIGYIEQSKYCVNCGKSSAAQTIFYQISRMLRIHHFHKAGAEKLKQEMNDDSFRLLSYDVYQLELIELSSILEVILRDFFEAFVYINYNGAKNNYVANIINKSMGNDFMNIEKANAHYKKALNINLRSYINDTTWSDLIDLVNMRNAIVHNNGMIDEKFKKTVTFKRVESCLNGDLLFLNTEKTFYYLNSVIEIATIIAELFEEKYSTQKFAIIANYYFNNGN